MSTMLRRAIEANLTVVEKQLQDTDDAKTKILAEIAELETSRNGIKSTAAKAVIQKEIDRLKVQSEKTAKPRPSQEYKAELTSLADGYRKVLAVMANIPAYVQSSKGRKPGWMAKTTPAKKTGVKRKYTRRNVD